MQGAGWACACMYGSGHAPRGSSRGSRRRCSSWGAARMGRQVSKECCEAGAGSCHWAQQPPKQRYTDDLPSLSSPYVAGLIPPQPVQPAAVLLGLQLSLTIHSWRICRRDKGRERAAGTGLSCTASMRLIGNRFQRKANKMPCPPVLPPVPAPPRHSTACTAPDPTTAQQAPHGMRSADLVRVHDTLEEVCGQERGTQMGTFNTCFTSPHKRPSV